MKVLTSLVKSSPVSSPEAPALRSNLGDRSPLETASFWISKLLVDFSFSSPSVTLAGGDVLPAESGTSAVVFGSLGGAGSGADRRSDR